jgi:hypothetical protein
MDFIPQTSEMVVVQANSVAQTFNLSELSEDEGHPLRAVWYLNYGLPKETYVNSRDYPAGHLNQLKDISVSWTPTQKMCASFTLMVTHTENDNRQNNHHPIDSSDAAFVTWWVNVYDSTSGGPSIADCLTSGGTSP